LVKDCLSCAVVFLWTLNWKYQKQSDVGLKDLQRDLPLKCFRRLLPIKSGCRVLCLLLFVSRICGEHVEPIDHADFRTNRFTVTAERGVVFILMSVSSLSPTLCCQNSTGLSRKVPPFSGNDLFLCTATWNFEVARNFQFMGFGYVLPYFTSW
jgi:hypothetical protein